MEEVVGSNPTRSTKSFHLSLVPACASVYSIRLASRALERPTYAYYSAGVADFLGQIPQHILGVLAAAHSHDLDLEQRQAWEQEIDVLKSALQGLDGTIFLEFDIPRLGSRADAVLISGPAIFPIEFKC